MTPMAHTHTHTQGLILSLLIILTIILTTTITTTHAISITPTTTSCNDITTGYCDIRFVLPTNNTMTISVGAQWYNQVDLVRSDIGTCELTNDGLIITPELQVKKNSNANGTYVARCSFQPRSGVILSQLSLGGEFPDQYLPAIAFSNFDLTFTPSTELDRINCSTAITAGSCRGNFLIPSELLPFRIETTSTLTLMQCTLDGDIIDYVTIQQESLVGVVYTYQIGLNQTYNEPSQIKCEMYAEKIAYAPHFHVAKNGIDVYRNFDIQYSAIEIAKIFTLCSMPEVPVCAIAFYVDDNIDISDLSIQPYNYLYQTNDRLTPEVCEALEQIVPDSVPTRPGKTVLCAIYRKSFHTPTTFLTETNNPFILSGLADLYPQITFVLGGTFFSGQRIIYNINEPTPITTYNAPLQLLQTQQQIDDCNNPNIPICTVDYSSHHEGPSLTLRLSDPPLSGIDFSYCSQQINSQRSLMTVYNDHRIVIDNLDQYVTAVNPVIPWLCTVGYYKHHTADYPLPSPVAVKTYDEVMGGRRFSLRSFDQASQVGNIDITNVLFSNIPLQHEFYLNCNTRESQDCTVELFVDYDETNPTNYMRSFDIFLPLIDRDFAYTHGRTTIKTSGFSSTDVTVTVLMSKDNELEEARFKTVTQESSYESAYFRVEISHKKIAEFLSNNVMRELYPEDGRHSIVITYPKSLNTNGDVSPTLLRYNNQPFPSALDQQPSTFQTTNPIQFYPRISFTGTESCRNPTNAYCLLQVGRDRMEDRYFYLRPLDPTLVGIFANIEFPSIPKLFQTPDGEVLTQVDFATLIGATYYTSLSHTFPLIKPYGLDTNPNIGLSALLEDENGEPVTENPGPDSPYDYPVVTVRHAYEYQVGFTYSKDLQPQFGADCESISLATCTLTYVSTSPVFLLGKDRVLIKHRIPTLAPTPSVTTDMTQEEIVNVVAQRLFLDWTPQNGFIKEARTPIAIFDATTSGTFNLQAYLVDSTNLIPNSSPAEYISWAQSDRSTDPTIPPEEPAGQIFPAHRPGSIFFRVDLSTEADGLSYISLTAFVKPLLVAWRDPIETDDESTIVNDKVSCDYNPTDPLGPCQLDQMNSILTGVFSGVMRKQGTEGGIGVNQFGLTVQLGLWASTPSARMYPKATTMHGSPSVKLEQTPSLHLPAIGYNPVEIDNMDDCLNSWKTGELTCTFRAIINGSPEFPIYNLTYASSLQMPSNWMLSNTTHYIYDRPTNPRDDLNGELIASRTGELVIDAGRNLVFMSIYPAYQKIHSSIYLTFIDSLMNPDGLLLDLDPFLTPPTQAPLYINMDFDISQVPASIFAIVTDPRFSLYDYIAGQSIFLLLPPMCNGPLLKIVSNQTRYNVDIGSSQYALVQYEFAARFRDISIENSFGYDFPVPCFNIPSDPLTNKPLQVDFSSPPVSLDAWLSISNRLKEIVRTYAKQNNLTLAEAKMKISRSLLPTTFDELESRAITAWLYPGLGDQSYLYSTSPITAIDQYPLFQIGSSCALWFQITSTHPSRTSLVRHHAISMSYSETFPYGQTTDPFILQLPVDYSLDLGYPHAVRNSALIAPDPLPVKTR